MTSYSVGNNYIQTGSFEELWVSRSVPAQGELAALKPIQHDSQVVLFREIETQISHPRKSYSQEYATRDASWLSPGNANIPNQESIQLAKVRDMHVLGTQVSFSQGPRQACLENLDLIQPKLETSMSRELKY
jgi:hypothetical protein